MKVAVLQMQVGQSRFDENFGRAKELAQEAASRGAELALLPEMFACGFNYGENKKALLAGRDFRAEFLRLAKDCGISLAGTVPCLRGSPQIPSNTMILASADGEELATYDKIHLFGVFREDRHVLAGDKIAVQDTPLGRLGFAICYDLRFPEFFAQMALKKPDLILVSAAWPHPRQSQLKTLAMARAIECQCHLALSNQAGAEHFGSNTIEYCGGSAIIEPFGAPLCECKQDAEDLQIAEADFSKSEAARAKIPVLNDRRPDIYFK
ncbi:MAG: hypothetical protein IKS15_05135 [Opitutales bacterium]|nr:hypothetical protein [Opitutales bacterium]